MLLLIPFAQIMKMITAVNNNNSGKEIDRPGGRIPTMYVKPEERNTELQSTSHHLSAVLNELFENSV